MPRLKVATWITLCYLVGLYVDIITHLACFMERFDICKDLQGF